MTRRQHFLEPLLRTSSTDRCVLLVERLGAPIATTIEVAFDPAGRKRGLLGRHDLAQGTAMIIAPCSAVHTWFMRFPIDIVFAGHDGRVRDIRHAVRPWRVAAKWRAFAAIELPSGTAKRCALRVDDCLSIVDVSGGSVFGHNPGHSVDSPR